MATRIILRNDTAANWTASNPTLALGEMGLETDTKKRKLGDGVTAWNTLTYEASGITLGETATDAYRGDRGKIAYDHSQTAHAPANAEQNVQADWNQTTTSSDDYIKNKPTIPAAQIQSDWSQASTGSLDYIKNKPVAVTTSVNGFMLATDKTKLDGIAANANNFSLPTASTSVLGGVKVDGTTVTISGGVISSAGSYTLPQATSSILGGVKVDGTTITALNGVISSTGGYSLPTASTSVLGGVKVDGSTVTISNGVISAVGSAGTPAVSVAAETSGATAVVGTSTNYARQDHVHAMPTIPTLTSVTAGTGLSGGAITTSGTISINYGTTATTACVGNDTRLSDARTPLAHNQAETTITFTDVTTGNASTTSHGFFPKLPTATGAYLKDDLTWGTPSGGGSTITRYDAGSIAGTQCYVLATGPGAVITKSTNTATITAPAGVQIISASIHFTAADIGANTNCLIDFGQSQGCGVNTASDYSDFFAPQWQCWADVNGSRAGKTTVVGNLNTNQHSVQLTGLTASQAIWVNLSF